MDETPSDKSLLRAVDRIFHSKNSDSKAKDYVLSWAKSRIWCHVNPDPIIAAEEIQARLQLIEDIGRGLGPSQHIPIFRLLQIACLVVIPFSRLEILSQELRKSVPPCSGLEQYLSLVVRGRLSTGDPISTSPLGDSYIQIEGSAEPIRSTMKETTKCFDREWSHCILTGLPCRDVCYIVPYMINAAEESMDQHSRTYLNTIISLFSGQSLDQLTSLGSCDKSWNMLCMNPILHYWWGECLFGLKCVGIVTIPNDDNCIMQLQFHWMHRNGLYPEKYVTPLDITIQRMLQDIPRQSTSLLTKECFSYLETGQIFYVVIPEKDVYKMKTMIDIRWVNTKFAALSGATGTWEIPEPLSRELVPELAYNHVEAWLRDLPESIREYEPFERLCISHWI